MWWQVLLAFVVFVLIMRQWKMRKLFALENQLKSDVPKLPFLGHAHHFFANHNGHMQVYGRFAREALDKGGITSMRIGDYVFVVIVDPVMAEIVLRVYMEKGDIMRFIKYVTGNGSIFAPVSIWRPRRKILAPTFNQKNLNSFVKIFAKQTNVMMNKLENKPGKGDFSFWPVITAYTMDSVCESTLGFNVESPNNSFLDVFEKACHLATKRIVEPWSFNDVLYKLNPDSKKLTEYKNIMCNFIYEVIKSKKRETRNEKPKDNHRQEKHVNFKTFLELLMDSSSNSGGYSDLELMEETLVIVMAGTDTSAVGAAFTALLLAQHQDVQDKVYDELKEIFGDSDRPTTSEDLPNLKYLDVVVKESLRLYPPVPQIVRNADRDFTLPSGITIVDGCILLVQIWGIHRNPEYWGADCEQFKPERFFEPYKHPAQFMAFSNGARNCLGNQYAMMSMKTVLSMLLRRYRLLPASFASTTTAGESHKPFKIKFDIMMKDVDHFTLQLEKRA